VPALSLTLIRERSHIANSVRFDTRKRIARKNLVFTGTDLIDLGRLVY